MFWLDGFTNLCLSILLSYHLRPWLLEGGGFGGLRSCLVVMVPFRWVTISAVKMAFSPF